MSEVKTEGGRLCLFFKEVCFYCFLNVGAEVFPGVGFGDDIFTECFGNVTAVRSCATSKTSSLRGSILRWSSLEVRR